MKYCIICRQPFLEPDFFCPTHGLRLRSAEEDQVRQCVDCASVIERGERFCRRCGFEVKDADWSLDSAGELPPRNVREDGSEPIETGQRAYGETNPSEEEESLRLRPFRRPGFSPPRRKRSRRHGRIGILVAAVIISLSLVAWHAFDLHRWNLAGQFSLFPVGAAPPANPHKPDTRQGPHTETDATEAEQQVRSPNAESTVPLRGDMEPDDLRKPELADGGPIPTLPRAKVDDGSVSETGKVEEPTASPKRDTQSTNAKRTVNKTRETAIAKGRSPVKSRAAQVRSLSPEEIQGQREADRKRVQREIAEAIAIRGVSGIEVAFINGTAFLAGEVQTATQKRAAEQAARRMPEVKDVRSRILVRWAAETQG